MLFILSQSLRIRVEDQEGYRDGRLGQVGDIFWQIRLNRLGMDLTPPSTKSR